MADETLKEDDENLEIVEVETLPTAEELAAAGDDKKLEDEDDDQSGDQRLAEGHDDEGDDKSPGAEKRRKRRQLQKEARDRTLRDLDSMRRENAALNERLTALEGTSHAARTQNIDDRIAAAKTQLAEAELIFARAIEAGNGDDAAAATRMRDEARDAERALVYEKTRIAAPAQPQVDPRVAPYITAWRAANPWYDGQSEDSLIVNAIETRVKSEGFDPSSRAYWEELTRRVERRLGAPEPETRVDTSKPDGRRKGPPMGSSREHAPDSTRREVYVTPERKQAMIEAGAWDDPVKRNRLLKAYADHDRNSAAR